MSYERLQITDHVDKWDVAKVQHLEDAIIANEIAINNAGGGAQADWSENDPNSASYIKNRICYSVDGGDLVIDNVNFTYTEKQTEEESYLVVVPSNNSYYEVSSNIDLANTPVVIIIDNEEYECESAHMWGANAWCWQYDYFNADFHRLFYNTDTHEWRITGRHDETQSYPYTKTISVRLKKEDIVPLEDKYIPTSVARLRDIQEIPQADWNYNENTNKHRYIKNRTHYKTPAPDKKLSGTNNEETWSYTQVWETSSYSKAYYQVFENDDEVYYLNNVIISNSVLEDFIIKENYNSIFVPISYLEDEITPCSQLHITRTLKQDDKSGKYIITINWSIDGRINYSDSPDGDRVSLYQGKYIYNTLDDNYLSENIKRVSEYDYSYKPAEVKLLFDDAYEAGTTWLDDWSQDSSNPELNHYGSYNIIVNNVLYENQKFIADSNNEPGSTRYYYLDIENEGLQLKVTDGEGDDYLVQIILDNTKNVAIYKIVEAAKITPINEMFIPDTIARAPKAALSHVDTTPTAEQYNALLDILKEAGIVTIE